MVEYKKGNREGKREVEEQENAKAKQKKENEEDYGKRNLMRKEGNYSYKRR